MTAQQWLYVHRNLMLALEILVCFLSYACFRNSCLFSFSFLCFKQFVLLVPMING